jgi:hypothetical protein
MLTPIRQRRCIVAAANGDRLVVGATRTTPTRTSLQFWQHRMAGTIGLV